MPYKPYEWKIKESGGKNMPYKWQPRECNAQGVPYVKIANVVLEKNGVLKTFLTQAEVDAAWADGWHARGRPETADVLEEEQIAVPILKNGDTISIKNSGPLKLSDETTSDGLVKPKRKRGRPRKNGNSS